MTKKVTTINELKTLITQIIKEESKKYQDSVPEKPININDSLKSILWAYSTPQILDEMAKYYREETGEPGVAKELDSLSRRIRKALYRYD